MQIVQITVFLSWWNTLYGFVLHYSFYSTKWELGNS